MGSTATENQVKQTSRDSESPPFYIDDKEENKLRIDASYRSPSLVVKQATSFDEYARQLMVPPAVMDLVRKASSLSFSTWETEGIRTELKPDTDPEREGFLRKILKWKYNGITEEELQLDGDNSHPPYIRVACTGKGDFDELAKKYLRDKYHHTYGDELGGYDDTHPGDYGSPVVLEIWPAHHYSPIHSHGDCTGIIYCLAGQVDVMAYKELDWNAEKLGILTLTPGQCAWLTKDKFFAHKVYCPTGDGLTRNELNNTGDYAATFHVYLNEGELGFKPALECFDPDPNTRDYFEYVKEDSHDLGKFATYSDLSWSILRRILAFHAASPNI